MVKISRMELDVRHYLTKNKYWPKPCEKGKMNNTDCSGTEINIERDSSRLCLNAMGSEPSEDCILEKN